jgi:UDP-2,3-diacylglucosamine pyrophosphatase LpxH
MATLFASDLHLDSEAPWAIDAFIAFLAGARAQRRGPVPARRLFEVWVGDDDDNADNDRTCAALGR